MEVGDSLLSTLSESQISPVSPVGLVGRATQSQASAELVPPLHYSAASFRLPRGAAGELCSGRDHLLDKQTDLLKVCKCSPDSSHGSSLVQLGPQRPVTITSESSRKY